MTNIKHIDKISKNVQKFKNLGVGSVFTKIIELSENKVPVLYMKLDTGICTIKKTSGVPPEEDFTHRMVIDHEEVEYNAICLTVTPGRLANVTSDCLIMSPSQCTLETDYNKQPHF